MKKIKETLMVTVKAIRYSFAFCLRNNKKDTITIGVLLVLQSAIGYLMVVLLGRLVSTVQLHLTDTKLEQLTIVEFVQAKYYVPILLFIAALFVEIILQKYRSYVGSRYRQSLRMANIRELNAFKATLDTARRMSKQYDDTQNKIDELPTGWNTRIDFAIEVMDFLGSLIVLIVFGVSLGVSHYEYVLILIAFSIPMVFVEVIAVNRLWNTSQGLVQHNKERSVMQSTFGGKTSFLQAVMFGQIPTVSAQIRQSQEFVLNTMNRVRWINLQMSLGAYLLAIIGLGTVLVMSIYGTLSVKGGDIGLLTIVIGSARRFQSAIREIVLQVANHWQSVKGTIMIEEEYFGMKPLLQTPNPLVPEFDGPPRIEFQKVSFMYPDTDVLVLREVSFTISPGSKVLIVGKNGSGKSSLLGLLLRHHDPVDGEIRVGDTNLKRITPATWSETACALLQNFTVFDRKVGVEIASSRMDEPMDMEKVTEAARFAGFDEVIAKEPTGYETQMGTEFGGKEFSGGQEQRLALARARYRNTRVLVLDEPDAKLDPEAATIIMNNVLTLKGVTVIVVTQHVSRAADYDHVIMLGDGEVIAQGTHRELMEQRGAYEKMYREDLRRKEA